MAFADRGVDLIVMIEDREDLNRNIGALKGQLTQLNERIAAAVKAPMEAAFAREGLAAGTIKFAIDNHIFKAVVSKTVEWDSDKLAAIAANIPDHECAEIFKLKYSVPEAIFRGMADHPMKAKLAAARTVKYGEPKIIIDD